MDLKAYLQKHRDLINRTLAMYLPGVRGPAFRVVEAMHYSLMAGGNACAPSCAWPGPKPSAAT